MEEEAALKMTALKAAYAEVILNASKEAAARVMVADRKAIRVEHELFTFKEESLRMLLRLKQMLDSKTAEADHRSRCQQEKIEELEAQLSEAEGIIIDLREELRQVQDELEKTKYNQISLFSKHNMLEEDAVMNTEVYNEDRQPSLNSQIITDIDSERYCPAYFSISEDPTRVAQTTVSQNQVVRSHLGEPASSEQDSCKEQGTSSSSDLDDKDRKIPDEPQSEMMDDDKCSTQSVRAGCRRPRNNVKYQEAIAALRPRAKSAFLPSIYRCSTSLAGRDPKHKANGAFSTSSFDKSAQRDEKNSDHGAPSDTTLDKETPKKDDHCDNGNAGASSARCDVDPVMVDTKLVGVDDFEGTKEGTHHQVDDDKNVNKTLLETAEKEALEDTELHGVDDSERAKEGASHQADNNKNVNRIVLKLRVADSKLHGIDNSKGAKEGTPHQADGNKNVKKIVLGKRKKEALATLDGNIVPETNGVKVRVVGDQGRATKDSK